MIDEMSATEGEKKNGTAGAILAAAAAADEAGIRREVGRITELFEHGAPEATSVLEDAAIQLAREHLLDDVRRALPADLDRRIGALVRAYCSGTARAAWKLASYDIPPSLPIEDAKEFLEKPLGPPPLPPEPAKDSVLGDETIAE